MPSIQVKAYAKLNLSLDVLGTRPDGYHEMRMVMQTVSLQDVLQLETGTGAPLQVTSNRSFLPADEHNLAAAAGLCLCREAGVDPAGLSIRLDKHIPVCAGMAGGSADAAAVLRGLNRLLNLNLSQRRLEEIGAMVGSDVPYCVGGGTALVQGRGERITPLPPLPHCWIVLCKPAFSISTPELFRALDRCRIRCRPDTSGLLAALSAGNLPEAARRMYNVFEDVLPPRRQKEVLSIKNHLLQAGALGASMSGTGPTVFGLFSAPEPAQAAKDALWDLYRSTFLVETVGQLMEESV